MSSRDRLAKEESERTKDIHEALAKSSRIDLKDFFPEFKDKLSEPYGHVLPGSPLGYVANLYRTIIVSLSPRPKPDFLNEYGIGRVEDLIELCGQNRVILLAGWQYGEYPRWFDEIFNKVYVPNMSRVFDFFRQTSKTASGIDVLDETLGALRRKLQASPFDTALSDELNTCGDPGRLINLLASDLAGIRLFASERLRSIILQLGDWDALYQLSRGFHQTLVYPVEHCIGGSNSLKESTLGSVNRFLGDNLRGRPVLEPKTEEVCSLLASLQWKSRHTIPMYVPRRIGNTLRYMQITEEIAEQERTFEALKSIRGKIQEGRLENVGDEAAALGMRIQQASQQSLYKFHEKPRKRAKRLVDFCLTAASTTALSQLLRLPGLFTPLLAWILKEIYHEEYDEMLERSSKYLVRKTLSKKMRVLPVAYDAFIFRV